MKRGRENESNESENEYNGGQDLNRLLDFIKTKRVVKTKIYGRKDYMKDKARTAANSRHGSPATGLGHGHIH